MIKGNCLLAVRAMKGSVFSVQYCCIEMSPWHGPHWRVFKRGAAVIHAELAIGRCIPDVAVVAEDRVFDAHRVEDTLDLAKIADRIAVKPAKEVDLLVGKRSSTGAVPALPSQKCSRTPLITLS